MKGEFRQLGIKAKSRGQPGRQTMLSEMHTIAAIGNRKGLQLKRWAFSKLGNGLLMILPGALIRPVNKLIKGFVRN